MIYKIIILIFSCIVLHLDMNAQYLENKKAQVDSLENDSSVENVLIDTENGKLKRIPVISEVLIGFASGSISALAFGAFSLAMIRPSGEMGGLTAVPFAYLGFIVGSSTGMYFVVHGDNPNTSWYLTNLSGLIGAAGGFGVSRILPGKNLMPMLIMPFLFELIYVNLLVPDGEDNLSFQNNYKDYQVINKNRTFDLYEQTKLFEINFLTIRF